LQWQQWRFNMADIFGLEYLNRKMGVGDHHFLFYSVITFSILNHFRDLQKLCHVKIFQDRKM
jgi:hypothetical protein